MLNYDSNQNLPVVSVITPSYNQGIYIRETIESVLNQDYPNIEYWIIDGGSTDQTIDILKSYGDRINWISQKDNGQADAVNKGIMLSKGSIIGWLNSDDIYLEGTVSHVVNYISKHSDIDMLYGEGYFIDQKSNVIDRYNTEEFDQNRLAQLCIICQPTAFFTRQIVKKTGLLNTNLDLCMDYEFWMRLSQSGNIKYTAKYLAGSRMYPENKTFSRKPEVYREACDILLQYYHYIPVNWLYGYCLQSNNHKFGVSFLFNFLLLNIKFNIRHLSSIINQLFSYYRNNKANLEYKGRYEDKWLSEIYECNITTKESINQLILKGSHIWPLRDVLEITVILDSMKVGTIILDSIGSFTKTCKLEKTLSKGKHRLKLIMNKAYCPNDYGICKDKRKLTFRLYDISFQ